MMNEDNTALNQTMRNFYNSLAWVLLDLSEPQSLLLGSGVFCNE